MSTIALQRVVKLLLGLLLAAATASALAEEPRQVPTIECPNKVKAVAGVPVEILNLNTANEKQIAKIPWVGKKTAHAILDKRKAVGSFKSMEQLLLINGIGDKAYACLVHYATVYGTPSGNTKEVP